MIKESELPPRLDIEKQATSQGPIIEKMDNAVDVENVNVVVFEHKKSFAYSIVASVCFGICNYVLGDLSSRIGVKSVYPSFFGYIFIWFLYHLSNSIVGFDITEGRGKRLFHKRDSLYYRAVP
jgi:hypothetical protein